MHTGYREGVGGLTHPSIGSIASAELGRADFPLPNFVSVGGQRAYGAGFLGARHQPLVVNDPARGVENLQALVGGPQFDRRVGLLEEMEQGFFRTGQTATGRDHRTTYERAVTLMRSREARAFDLSQERAAVRDAYGRTDFGQGCLMARRLVEVGIPFVEVYSRGWDTHQDNFNRVRTLSREVDPAMSALVTDLRDRGLLDSTLIVWMGEFGRTPQITSRAGTPGRNHYPRAWSTVLLGGGIRGGQVIGRTDGEGAQVVERPVSALDFLASVCRVLGINYERQNQTPIGRPLRIVDRGANPIRELFA
jgi:hypothetical protein